MMHLAKDAMNLQKMTFTCCLLVKYLSMYLNLFQLMNSKRQEAFELPPSTASLRLEVRFLANEWAGSDLCTLCHTTVEKIRPSNYPRSHMVVQSFSTTSRTSIWCAVKEWV